MRLVADVHGATVALRQVAQQAGPLLVLGDLINFIDYRDNEGIVTEVSGKEFTDKMVALRTAGEAVASMALWADFRKGREDELRAAYDAAIEAAYDDVLGALTGSDCYITFGNVDRPQMIRDKLPPGAKYVDGEVVEIEGRRVGFAGGGIISINTAGEVSEDDMAAKLAGLGPVDILCTHVPPAIEALQKDVIGGRVKGSAAVLSYIKEHQPPHHYFGDVHQPQATTWRIGNTTCHNVGYFRATGRATEHV